MIISAAKEYGAIILGAAYAYGVQFDLPHTDQTLRVIIGVMTAVILIPKFVKALMWVGDKLRGKRKDEK